MTEEKDSFAEVYTATMARVYEDQGHFDKAAKVYRHLLEQEPDRKDFQDALARVMNKARRSEQNQNVVTLFRSWIDLCMQYNAVRRLKKLGYGRNHSS